MRTHSLRRLAGSTLGVLVLGVSSFALAAPAGAAESDSADSGARHRVHLTDEQKQCLSDQGITRPVRPLTPEKIEALKAAAEACDIKLPNRHRPNLTDEQKQCLSEHGVTRPVRPLTPEKVQALKAAAEACGIQRPAGDGAQS